MASKTGMRILQVMRAPVGGLFRHVADLTAELASRGHDIGLVVDSLAGDGQTEARLAEVERHASLGIHRMPIPRVLGLHDVLTPWKIRKLANALGVHVLHGHGAKGGFGARLARIGSDRMAALYTPHGGVLHFNSRSPSGALFMTIERALLRTTDAIIFESAYGQKVFAEKVATPRCLNTVVHNGVREDEFTPITPLDEAADFAFVGELRMLKGVDLILSALAPLKRMDGSPATLVMAGDGPDADFVRRRIAELDLSSRVTLAGVRPAREIFARGRCVLVPSRAESLPYIILEAAAAGRPVIATDVGGITEIFGPTANDLIAPDSSERLGAAMAEFLDAPERMETAALTRRDHVAQKFSVRHMTDQIEHLYQTLTSKR